MKKIITLIIVLISVNAFGQDYQTDTIKITSSILNEDRKVIIYKPDNINAIDSVEFIYLLDGEFAGYRYKKIHSTFPNKKIIGIGILNTDRRRDMLPLKAPEKFMEFMATELIPKVEKDCQVKNRVLFGHSFAGVFVINTMLKQPGLFNKYIASSPTPIMNFIDATKYHQLDNVLSTSEAFYFSYGSEDMKQVKKWALRLDESLKSVKFHHINWKHEVLQGKNHSNSDLVALVAGMKF